MNNTTIILLIAAAAAFFYFSQQIEELPIPAQLPAGAIPPGTNTKAEKWQLAFSIFNSLIATGLNAVQAWQQAQQQAAVGGCLNNRNDFYAI